jgi:alpha-amylase/alpha-mannosidase (GH57 family)
MIRIIIGIIIGVALFASLSQADDKVNTVTPTEFVSSVAAVPGKVSEHLKNEWTDIKEFQAQGWADAKAQNQANWEKLKSLFNTTKSTN